MPVKRAKKIPKSKPLANVPRPPTGMKGKYAIAYWKRIAAGLVSVEAITDLHLEALEALCRQWQIYRELSDWCDKHPKDLIVESGKNGHLCEHPNVRLRQQAYDNLTKLWPKFGCTPDGLGKLGKNTPAAAKPATANPVQTMAARKGSR